MPIQVLKGKAAHNISNSPAVFSTAELGTRYKAVYWQGASAFLDHTYVRSAWHLLQQCKSTSIVRGQ